MILNVLILSAAIFVVAQLLPGIRIKSVLTAVIVAIVYSIINFLAGWLLVILALPLIVVTFGVFKLVINAFLLWVTDQLIEDFEIDGVLTTLGAAVLITVVDAGIKWLF
ncbi:MAG: hypothetical protein CSA29_01245 [Desulfobacterales bacterium]|nr:MAG: hypothetical protein CSA29_01245 [Desulfobacterales bacterium]